MHITIGCIDGNSYSSDSYPESVIQDEIDSVGGLIGTGLWENMRIHTVDEFCEWFDTMLSDGDDEVKTTTVTLVIDGQDRVFNYEHIVWHEIVRD